MNLLQIRQKLVVLSGRQDLASTSPESMDLCDIDAGADFFIQAASRALDREQENATTESWFEKSLAVGDYLVDLEDCRNISQVWYVNSDGEEVKLDWLLFEELRSEDYYPMLGSTTSGAPLNWSRYPRTRPPAQVYEGSELNVHSIIIMPPTDAAITVRVYGKFYSAKLVNNADENFWSYNHEDILIAASLREIEYFYRNSEGYKDFDLGVMKKLHGIDIDLASIDAADSMEMEG
jgi:hypothetical protein